MQAGVEIMPWNITVVFTIKFETFWPKNFTDVNETLKGAWLDIYEWSHPVFPPSLMEAKASRGGDNTFKYHCCFW